MLRSCNACMQQDMLTGLCHACMSETLHVNAQAFLEMGSARKAV